MHPQRKKRLTLIVFMVLGLGAAVALMLYSMKQSINLFMTPTQIANGEVAQGQTIRAGGLVVAGSVQRNEETLQVSFSITDGDAEVTVLYNGILPDLFREGQGIVALGKVNELRQLLASEVLAKHDEKYIPPEVKHSLEEAHANGIKKLEAARD